MRAGSPAASIRMARSPALCAPPIDTVATGTPAGICTIDRSESIPSRYVSGTGTPITGSGVTAASMPGRWAAPPAPAMMHLRPRPAAALPNAIMASGVRCAETTSTSCAISNSVNTAAAAFMTVQSESDPMTTATRGAWRGSGMPAMLTGHPETRFDLGRVLGPATGSAIPPREGLRRSEPARRRRRGRCRPPSRARPCVRVGTACRRYAS